MLDLSVLQKALASLKKAIDRSQKEPDDLEVRDSVIQRFEYCYEISWKMLKRRLRLDSPSPGEVEEMSFRELFREGAVKGLIDNPEDWFVFRDQRNLTMHTYNEEIALSVYKTAKQFYTVAEVFLERIISRNT